jgi:uncharacterized protein with PIN domain
MLPVISDRNPSKVCRFAIKRCTFVHRVAKQQYIFIYELTNMSSSTPDRETAHRILKQFDLLALQQKPSPLPDPEAVRQAVLLVASQSDYQMLGVCADTLEQGIGALATYGRALGYEPNLELGATLAVSAKPQEGAVYIKFNPNSAQCYASPYDGEHRGVLISCQSAEETDVNEMYGHLPLDLFA